MTNTILTNVIAPVVAQNTGILLFIKTNWAIIAPICVLALSELLPFLPTKSNGIIQSIIGLIKKSENGNI